MTRWHSVNRLVTFSNETLQNGTAPTKLRWVVRRVVTIAARLKRLRQEKDWSQDDLAARIEVNRTTISHWEKGKRIPPLEMAQKLSEIFGVSVDYLLARTDTRASGAPPTDLAARWPNLSPDRRERALKLQAFLGKRGYVARDWDDATFDLFETIALTTAKSLGEARKKEPPRGTVQ